MRNVTKMKIGSPPHDVFEAIVDPEKIGNFWFSTASSRWESGMTVTLRYEEYNAEVGIRVLEAEQDQKIVFQWGTEGDGNLVTLSFQEADHGSTIMEAVEEGFNQTGDELIGRMLDNKEGWVFMLSCLKAYLEFGVCSLRAGLVK